MSRRPLSTGAVADYRQHMLAMPSYPVRLQIAQAILLGVCALLISCSAKPPASQEVATTSEFIEPAWYYQLPDEPDLLYGYGSGSDDAEARRYALAEIAAQIRAQVRSQSQTITSERSDSIEGSQYFSEHDSELFVSSGAELTGARLQQRSMMGDKVYVAYSYDRRPLLTRIQAACAQQLAASEHNRKTYLEQTPLLQALRANGCQQRVRLHKRSGLWYLNYAGQDFWLTSGDIRAGIFSNQHSPSVQLELSQGALLDKDSYFFINFRQQDLPKPRYVSIFHIDEFGNVQSLVLNQVYDQVGAVLTHPNSVSSQGLRVAPLHSDTYTEELILAFSCAQERPQWRSFLPVRQNQYNLLDESTRQLAHLLRTSQDCDFASASYRIAPNS